MSFSTDINSPIARCRSLYITAQAVSVVKSNTIDVININYSLKEHHLYNENVRFKDRASVF